jgi:hypothetical protein
MKFKAIFVDPEQQHLTVPSKEFGYVSNNAASSVFGGWEGNCVFGQRVQLCGNGRAGSTTDFLTFLKTTKIKWFRKKTKKQCNLRHYIFKIN